MRDRRSVPFATIDEALADIREGRIVLVVDDADRENEGDFIMAAERCTPEAINFMVTHGRGIVCLPGRVGRLDELQIPQMVSTNGGDETAFTVSIDFAPEITTGTSAFDRAATARAIADPGTKPHDFLRPGHVFPLRAKEGGVLRRAGHTEAAVDLATLAGMFPAGVICEVMNPDGSMARLPELARVAREHDLKLISIADLIEYRRKREVLVARVAEATIPTAWGEFRAYAYESLVDGRIHVALVPGRRRRRHGRADAGALGVPDRRRVRLAALRLRPAARPRDRADRRRRAAASCCTSAATRAARSG